MSFNTLKQCNVKTIPLDFQGNQNQCLICDNQFFNVEKENDKLPCNHYNLFCKSCWFSYLEQKITEKNILKIKCMYNNCETTLSKDFLLSQLSEDESLLLKYKEQIYKLEIILDPNKKFCPYPSCNSYLIRNSCLNNNYVSCINGHKYCFECLLPPHGELPCLIQEEIIFEDIIKEQNFKRCPFCQYYTEKSFGCNVITCPNCKGLWCWLCRGKYTRTHYEEGTCKHLQFLQSNNLDDIKGKEMTNKDKSENNTTQEIHPVSHQTEDIFSSEEKTYGVSFDSHENSITVNRKDIMILVNYKIYHGTKNTTNNIDQIFNDISNVNLEIKLFPIYIEVFLYIIFLPFIVGILSGVAFGNQIRYNTRKNIRCLIYWVLIIISIIQNLIYFFVGFFVYGIFYIMFFRHLCTAIIVEPKQLNQIRKLAREKNLIADIV